MKTGDKQIIAMLEAFDQDAVLKAFDLYKQGIEDGFKKTINQLKEDGWESFDKKPVDKEFYLFQNKYWVQNEQAREAAKQDFLKEAAERKKTKKGKNYTGQKMNLKISEIKCPKCNAAMYKQGVCNGCKEGKKGFKIRLICEENPDHEILL